MRTFPHFVIPAAPVATCGALQTDERDTVARTPNYQFERQERDRAKAAKLAEKAAAKRRAREAKNPSEQSDAAPSSAED